MALFGKDEVVEIIGDALVAAAAPQVSVTWEEDRRWVIEVPDDDYQRYIHALFRLDFDTGALSVKLNPEVGNHNSFFDYRQSFEVVLDYMYDDGVVMINYDALIDAAQKLMDAVFMDRRDLVSSAAWPSRDYYDPFDVLPGQGELEER